MVTPFVLYSQNYDGDYPGDDKFWEDYEKFADLGWEAGTYDNSKKKRSDSNLAYKVVYKDWFGQYSKGKEVFNFYYEKGYRYANKFYRDFCPNCKKNDGSVLYECHCCSKITCNMCNIEPDSYNDWIGDRYYLTFKCDYCNKKFTNEEWIQWLRVNKPIKIGSSTPGKGRYQIGFIRK